MRTKAKKSIANFKVRKGMEIGVMVTLRGNVMYEFLDRLINVAMPRIKDFRGANPNAFDGHGNYSLGVTEQIIFPEIDYDKIERVSGMNIAIVTTAKTDAEARQPARPPGHAVPQVTGGEQHGKKSGDREEQPQSRSTVRAGPTGARSAAGRGATCGSSSMCRICFRKLASEGKLPGVTKSSW